MPSEACSSTNLCSRESTKTIRTTMRMSTGSFPRGLNVSTTIVIFVIFLTTVNSLPYGRPHQRTIRLCSKSLSDALYLVCHDRGGYNEPFSYGGEDEVRAPSGPGLVEECCYRPCSYEQLEQYCKPLVDDKTNSNNNNNSQDGIEESLRIVNLPYTSMRELVTERRDVTSKHNDKANTKSKDRSMMGVKGRATRKGREHAQGCLRGKKIVRKADRRRRIRGHLSKHNRINNDNRDDDIDDADVKVTSRHDCRRRRRPKRPRRGKAAREAVIDNVPEFKVGTTLPEPKDSVLLLFPSRTDLVIQRTTNDFAGDRGDVETFEKDNFIDANNNDLRRIDRELAHPQRP